jgi:hypothetical protein
MATTPTIWVVTHQAACSRRDAPRAPTIAITTATPKTLVTGHGQASLDETGTLTAAINIATSKETGVLAIGRNHANANPNPRAIPKASAAPSGTR